jgi:hypothetical protein
MRFDHPMTRRSVTPIKRRSYRPGDRAAPYAGPDPIEQSRRLAEADAAVRRAIEQSEEPKE